MLEKLSTSLLAGVPSIVKPSPGSYLTNAVFQDMIESGFFLKELFSWFVENPEIFWIMYRMEILFYSQDLLIPEEN
jgi:oxepin-CoA hydrolase/3-oxo-5,6-dehydrosuberyl-CoA semialdehyde dehydrogenase